MPRLTRWFIRASLLFFITALLLRLVQAANGFWEFSSILKTLSPVYFHLFLVGWVTQLIFGVIYWMFPKYSRGKPRGRERVAWGTFWLINIGLLLRVAGEPLKSLSPQGLVPASMLVASALFQWLAGFLFVVNTWPRVKER